MRIAFFTDSFLPTHDGVARITGSLAVALHRLGHRVTIFTAQTPGTPRHERMPEGPEIVRSVSAPVPHYGQYRWALLPLWALVGRRFGRTFDLVHIHTPGTVGASGFLAARHWNLPLIGTFHTNMKEMRESFPSDPLTGLFFRVAWWFNTGLYWRCDLVTAPTPEALEALLAGSRKSYRVLPRVIPNGIETSRFRPGIREPDWSSRWGSKDLPLVTFLGRLTQDKGVYRFLDALALLPEDLPFLGVVAGTGLEDERVRRRISEDPRLRSRVRFAGPVSEEEKAALLSQSTLFVLPSVADTSSLAALEAMASGAACILTNRGGPRTLGGNGRFARLVDPLDIPHLSETIAGLLRDPNEARRLAARAREYVEGFCSIDSTARHFVNVYQDLLRERAGGYRVRTPTGLSAWAPPR